MPFCHSQVNTPYPKTWLCATSKVCQYSSGTYHVCTRNTDNILTNNNSENTWSGLRPLAKAILPPKRGYTILAINRHSKPSHNRSLKINKNNKFIRKITKIGQSLKIDAI